MTADSLRLVSIGASTNACTSCDGTLTCARCFPFAGPLGSCRGRQPVSGNAATATKARGPKDPRTAAYARLHHREQCHPDKPRAHFLLARANNAPVATKAVRNKGAASHLMRLKKGEADEHAPIRVATPPTGKAKKNRVLYRVLCRKCGAYAARLKDIANAFCRLFVNKGPNRKQLVERLTAALERTDLPLKSSNSSTSKPQAVVAEPREHRLEAIAWPIGGFSVRFLCTLCRRIHVNTGAFRNQPCVGEAWSQYSKGQLAKLRARQRGRHCWQHRQRPAEAPAAGSRGSGAMTGSCSRLRLGTLNFNVRTLSGRLPAVLEFAVHADLDIVCLQETRLVDESVKAATSGARAASWQFVPGLKPSIAGETLLRVLHFCRNGLSRLLLVLMILGDPRCRGRFLVASLSAFSPCQCLSAGIQRY